MCTSTGNICAPFAWYSATQYRPNVLSGLLAPPIHSRQSVKSPPPRLYGGRQIRVIILPPPRCGDFSAQAIEPAAVELVAFASGRGEGLAIENGDPTPTILYEAGALQLSDRHRDPGATQPEHR